jgi:hypothetical protein
MLKEFVYILCIYMKSNFAFSSKSLPSSSSLKKHLIFPKKSQEMENAFRLNPLVNLNHLLAVGAT